MPRPKTEAATYKSLMLRLPEPVLRACKAQATKKHRSLNAQLLTVIENWLQGTEESTDHELVGSREN